MVKRGARPDLRVVLLAGALASAWGCSGRSPEDWVARVESLEGAVQLAVDPGAPLQPARAGLHIRIGGRLETGPSSKAVLHLRNGGQLTIQPGSVVHFRSNMPERELHLALQQGAVIGQGSEVEASELVITTGGQRVKLAGRSSVRVSAADPNELSKVSVIYGEATVEQSGKTVTVHESQELVLGQERRPSDAAPARLDAGAAPDAAPEVTATELVFYLQASGKGKVLVRRPGERKFTRVKNGEVITIRPGTEIKLLGQSTAMVGVEKGTGTIVRGPAQVLVEKGPAPAEGAKPTVRLQSVGDDMQISSRGKPGTEGTPFHAEGVTIVPRVTYRRIEMRVRRERGRALLSVSAGEATLTGKAGKVVKVEAGQDAVLSRGTIAGPNMPGGAPLEVKSGGSMRVFTPSAQLPVTFRWTLPEGATSSLVEVSRSPSMSSPIFSDAIRRKSLTVPALGHGTVYWRVRPVQNDGSPGAGVEGKLALIKDTSYRRLKDQQAPKNTIHESYGNTTVYYQNMLPRFTFRWEAMTGASQYQIKIYREQSLIQPLYSSETRGTSISVAGGKLGEGNFIWYVAGRGGSGEHLRSTKSNRLSIRYDNATPDLQIIYPPNGITVSGASLEANGVTTPGSRVSINGREASLDETSRFTQTVALKPGLNHIIFLVVDPRRGASYYLRQVTRK